MSWSLWLQESAYNSDAGLGLAWHREPGSVELLWSLGLWVLACNWYGSKVWSYHSWPGIGLSWAPVFTGAHLEPGAMKVAMGTRWHQGELGA